jgi:hypothetical protein
MKSAQSQYTPAKVIKPAITGIQTLNPCSGVTTRTQPFGCPLLSIHRRVDGFLALSFHPPSSGPSKTSS